jgi:glycosyltransferase involved in cell wall biosynthesis
VTPVSAAAVVIGRNEGVRLERCLKSLACRFDTVVYVDSGSTDGSTEVAAQLGAHVVDLDLSSPFTAARARNAGFAYVLNVAPEATFVQFVDGDCEVQLGWTEAATRFLLSHPGYAVVCGRRRERHPEHSVYNWLCDQEWNTPVGEANSCGGDAMMRVDAFSAIKGYRDDMIAGEEPELCFRLRQSGWKIYRIDAEMTVHDAAIYRFGQWWKRNVRSGHAYAEGAWLHGSSPERYWVKEARRALLWGLWIPAAIVALPFILGSWWPLLGTVVYPIQLLRLWVKNGTLTTASFLLVGRFAEARGAIEFYWRLASGRGRRIIEYK